MVQYGVLFIASNISKINLIQLNSMFNFPFYKVNNNIRMKMELKLNIFGWLQDVNCKSKAICWKTSLMMQKTKDWVRVFCIVVLVLKCLKQQSTRTC